MTSEKIFTYVEQWNNGEHVEQFANFCHHDKNCVNQNREKMAEENG